MNSKIYFDNLHDNVCNQKYDGLPYSFHLNAVRAQLTKYQHLITDLNDYSAVLIAVDGHDSIEDARLTYNDIKEMYGVFVAEIIYLCTEDKGRTRDERKSTVWYTKLKENKHAVFVKLCDILANVKYSMLMNSSMLKKYKQEYVIKVKPILYSEKFKPMFDELDKLFELA